MPLVIPAPGEQKNSQELLIKKDQKIVANAGKSVSQETQLCGKVHDGSPFTPLVHYLDGKVVLNSYDHGLEDIHIPAIRDAQAHNFGGF